MRLSALRREAGKTREAAYIKTNVRGQITSSILGLAVALDAKKMVDQESLDELNALDGKRVHVYQTRPIAEASDTGGTHILFVIR